jgi:hypothetical protein
MQLNVELKDVNAVYGSTVCCILWNFKVILSYFLWKFLHWCNFGWTLQCYSLKNKYKIPIGSNVREISGLKVQITCTGCVSSWMNGAFI